MAPALAETGAPKDSALATVMGDATTRAEAEEEEGIISVEVVEEEEEEEEGEEEEGEEGEEGEDRHARCGPPG